MSKSIKLKNGNYMDTHGIVHKKQLLSDMIAWSGTGNLTIKFRKII